MKNKINVDNIFDKWFPNYKKTIDFSIVDRPSQALKSSFNAGYVLGCKYMNQQISYFQEANAVNQIELEALRHTNQKLSEHKHELEQKIKLLEEELGYQKKRA